jgi:hypothetical protein
MRPFFAVRCLTSLWLIATLTVTLAFAAWFEVQSAVAAPRWSKPALVSKTQCRKGYATRVQAAQNARGDAVVAWVEEHCATFYDGRWRIVAVSRKAGHRFGRSRIIHSGGHVTEVQLGVALDEHGGGTIAWTRMPTYNSAAHPDTGLLVSTRRPGGRFSRPRLVDEHGGRFDLAANATGETVLAWVHFAPPNTYARIGSLVAAIRSAGTTRFGEPQTLSGPPAAIASTSAAIAPDGAALAGWTRADGTAYDCCTAFEASIRLPGQAFASPEIISPLVPELSHAPAVAVASRGIGVIAWTTSQRFKWPPPPAERVGIYASRWDGQAFSAPHTIESAMDDVFSGPGVLLARDGRATIEWYRGYSRSSDICGLPSRYAVALPATGSPGPPAMISPPNGLQSSFASALDIADRPIRVWFQGTALKYEKIGCYITASRVGAAIDGGPTIHGPAIPTGPAGAFSAAPARAPMLVWAEPGRGVISGRVVMSTLREAP